ncbi:MAG: hypothetical protein LBT12_02710, partial [Oscillospiraceae bacterium]|nr:hypothetical protein [Oscillospiraceae bacterium]
MKKRTNRALAYLLTLAMALALLPAITPPARAAVGERKWVNNLGGGNVDYFTAITELSDGSAVAVGYAGQTSFSGSGDFTGLTGKGDTDAIIAKYDKTGYREWRSNLGGSANDQFYGVTELSDGSIVAVGFALAASFSGSGDFFEAHLTGKGNTDAIIAWFDAVTGDVTRVENFGGGGNDYFTSVTALSGGGFAAAGNAEAASFSVSGDFFEAHLTGKGNEDAIIAKYGAAGNKSGVINLGGLGVDRFTGVTELSDGSLVAAGYANATSFPADVAGTGDFTGLTGKGGYDAVIAWFDAGMSEQPRVENLGGAGTDYFNGVTALSDGGVAAAGYAGQASFSGSGDFYGDSLTGKGDTDAIIAKYDAGGTRRWMKNFGGSGLDMFNGVTELSDGNVAAAGSATVNNSAGDFAGLTVRGSTADAILAGFNAATGDVTWVRSLGGTGADYFYGVTALSDGGVAAAGYAGAGSLPTDVAGNGDFTGLTGKGNSDAIIARYTGSTTKITPDKYMRVRDSHITLTVTGKSTLGATDAARTAEIKYFREPVNGAHSLTDGAVASATAFDNAYTDANSANATMAAGVDTKTFAKDAAASDDTLSIFKETITADQNARYWVLTAYTNTGDSETVYEVTHYDVKNIFTTAPVWMSGYDEGTDASARADEFANELLAPLSADALKTGIPFDLMETKPQAADFDTKGEYNWSTSALKVVDLSSLSAEYTNAHLAYDEIDLYPLAYQKNLYAWEYSYVQNEMPKLWGAAASGDKFPTVKLDGDFIDTSENTYCDSNDPQYYIAWLIKGEAYKKIRAEFVNVDGDPVEVDSSYGMDILVPINWGYVQDATVVPGGPDDWEVSGAPNDGNFHGTWDSGRFYRVGGAIKPPREAALVPRGWYVANTAIIGVALTDTNTDQTGKSGFVPRYDFYQIDPKLHVDSASESVGVYSLTGSDKFYIVYDEPIPVVVTTNHRSADQTGDPIDFSPTLTPITGNDYEFEAYGVNELMTSHVAYGVEAYYLEIEATGDVDGNRKYLDYTIINHSGVGSTQAVDKTTLSDSDRIIYPTFEGAPWESQDAFFGIKIDNSKLYTLT